MNEQDFVGAVNLTMEYCRTHSIQDSKNNEKVNLLLWMLEVIRSTAILTIGDTIKFKIYLEKVDNVYCTFVIRTEKNYGNFSSVLSEKDFKANFNFVKKILVKNPNISCKKLIANKENVLDIFEFSIKFN